MKNKLIEKRIFAHIIDGFVINLLSVPVYEYIISEDIVPLYGFLFQLLLYFSYFFFLEMIFKKTLGKFFMNLKVEGDHFFLRTICRFIPFDIVSFIFNDGILWHDSLSKTSVVQSKN